MVLVAINSVFINLFPSSYNFIWIIIHNCHTTLKKKNTSEGSDRVYIYKGIKCTKSIVNLLSSYASQFLRIQ